MSSILTRYRILLSLKTFGILFGISVPTCLDQGRCFVPQKVNDFKIQSPPELGDLRVQDNAYPQFKNWCKLRSKTRILRSKFNIILSALQTISNPSVRTRRST